MGSHLSGVPQHRIVSPSPPPEWAPCCTNCARFGPDFCSPKSGNCYGHRTKDYYVSCPNLGNERQDEEGSRYWSYAKLMQNGTTFWVFNTQKANACMGDFCRPNTGDAGI